MIRKIIFSLFLLLFVSARAQRADSLPVSRWIKSPAPFYRQQKIERVVEYEQISSKSKRLTGVSAKFDTLGNATDIYRAGLSGEPKKYTYAYNELGQPIRETAWTDRLHPETTHHFEYNVNDHPLGEFVIEYGDTAYLKHWQYDTHGRTAIVFGTPVPILRDVYIMAGWTEFFYDSLNRLVQTVGHSAYRAPSDSMISDSSLARRARSKFKIDSTDNLCIVDYMYNGDKVLKYYRSTIDKHDGPITFLLDEHGRVSRIDYPASYGDLSSHILTYTYNDEGLLTKCTERVKKDGAETKHVYVYEYTKRGEKKKKKKRGPVSSSAPEQY